MRRFLESVTDLLFRSADAVLGGFLVLWGAALIAYVAFGIWVATR